MKTGLKEISCKNGRWIELPRNRVPQQAFVLQVMNIWVLRRQGVVTLNLQSSTVTT
jgi:hypothetical protein